MVVSTFGKNLSPPSLLAIESKSTEEFTEALMALERTMTSKQRSMLVAHAEAPDHLSSMRTLANVAGYPSHGTANIQYGKLGRKFADFFGVHDLVNQTQAIAWADGRNDESGHFAWILREQLVKALRTLGWIDEIPREDSAREAAAREIDQDASTDIVSATVRQTLIDARVGQGAYRARLMAIWNQRCALTGCTIKEVLVASHAKPWAVCTNEERLDEYNGLLLAAHVDKLFDAGHISFTSDGALLRKPEVTDSELGSLGLSAQMRLSHVAKQHIPYLAAHRQMFGFQDAQS